MYVTAESKAASLPLASTLNCEVVSGSVEQPEAVNTVNCYLTRFNQGDYGAVADLFAAEGALVPPFETPVVGRDAIASYLQQEADGMVVNSPTIISLKGDGVGGYWVRVRGRVTALVFEVSLAWQFSLSPQYEIEQVKIELLASLEELIGLNSK
ncbi:MAG: nuclear transport factor 2 family protein [Cyanothece sp. SIO2G6]|nr:nuclear transport factor 2 family protein [Cyanothece sp. SIO2G6]